MTVKIRDSGVQREDFLRSPPSFEAELAPLLLPGWPMRLFHEVVAAGGGDHLNVLHTVEHGKRAQGRTITPELVGVDELRHVVLVEQAHEKTLGRLSVAVLLKTDVQHVSVFVDRLPTARRAQARPFWPRTTNA